MRQAPKNVTAILEAYGRLPDTPARPSRRDRRLAHRLVSRRIPLPVIEAAFLLATARRIRSRTRRLPAIRSLHYFLPVIDEVLKEPLDPAYIDHLRRIVEPQPAQPMADTRSPAQSHPHRQKQLFHRDDQDTGARPKNSVFT